MGEEIVYKKEESCKLVGVVENQSKRLACNGMDEKREDGGMRDGEEE